MIVEGSPKVEEELAQEIVEESEPKAEPMSDTVPEPEPLNLQPAEGELKSPEAGAGTAPGPSDSFARLRSPSISFSTETSTDEVSRKPKYRKKKSTVKREARLEEALAAKGDIAATAISLDQAETPESLRESVLDLDGKDLEDNNAFTELLDDEAAAPPDQIAVPKESAAKSPAEDAVVERDKPQAQELISEPAAEAESAAVDNKSVIGANPAPNDSDSFNTEAPTATNTAEEVAADMKLGAMVDEVQPATDSEALAEESVSKEHVAAASAEGNIDTAGDPIDGGDKNSQPEAISYVAKEDSAPVVESIATEGAPDMAETSTDTIPAIASEPAAKDADPPEASVTAVESAQSAVATSAKTAKQASTYIDAANESFVRPLRKSVSRSNKSESLTYSDLKRKGSIKRAMDLAVLAAEAPRELKHDSKQGYFREAPRRHPESDVSDDTEEGEEYINSRSEKSHSRHDSGVAGISKKHKHKHRSSRRPSTSDPAVTVGHDSGERHRKHHQREQKKQDEKEITVHSSREDWVPQSSSGSSSIRRHRRREATGREVEGPRSDNGSARDRRNSRTSEEVKAPLRKLLSGIKKEVARSFYPEFSGYTSRGMMRPARD